jgi:hypothetical protein
MALDTAAKRKSAIGIGLLCLRLGVVPDGSNLAAPQRLHANALYSGISAEEPSEYTGGLEGITTAMGLMGVGR